MSVFDPKQTLGDSVLRAGAGYRFYSYGDASLLLP